MKTLSNKVDVVKVASIGDYNFELNLNLSEEQATKFKLDLDQVKSAEYLKQVLRIQEAKDLISVNSKSLLVNVLLYMNKTNRNKSFIEYMTLNPIVLNEEFSYLKEKIISEFDDHFIQIKELNCMPFNNYTINVNVENKGKKSLDGEVSAVSNENVIYKNSKEINQNPSNINENKNDEIKKIEYKKEEHKKDEAKKEESNKEEPKKDEIKKAAKKEDLIKQEPKKEEPKKEEPKTEEPKKEEPKKEELKKEETKKDEPKKDEPNPNESIDNKPKKGNNNKLNTISLPLVEKPHDIKQMIKILPEGKEDKESSKLIDYNQIDKHKNSPIILTKKKIVNHSNSNSIIKIDNLNKSLTEFSSIKYDFEASDYLIIDLNTYIDNKYITLNEIYDYLCQNIIQAYLNTTIILIFPSADKVNNQNLTILSELVGISDITIYDRRDATKVCGLLGYKVEDKNFELRFMFLKEFKRSNYKAHRTAMFLDDFNKFTVLVQEIETNLIILHNNFNFNVGFKIDYFKTISNNFDLLRSAFLGGVLSRVVQNQDYEFAFKCGSETFVRLLEALFSKLEVKNDPGYFIISKNNKLRDFEKEKIKTKGKNFAAVEKNFFLDSINVRDSKLKQYDPLKDKHLTGFFSNKNVRKQLRKQGFKLKKIKKNSSPIVNPLEYIKNEQNKYLNILDQNQQLQKKLVNLFSSPNRNQETLNNSMIKISKVFDTQSNDSMYRSRKLPGLNTAIDYDPFQKIANAPNYIKDSEKKEQKTNLKPIERRSCDNPKFTQKNKIIGSFNNTEMKNMLTSLQTQQNKSPYSDENSKEKMGQTATFNPQLFQQYMATMSNSGFYNQMAMSMKANSKEKKNNHFNKNNKNNVYPLNKNQSKNPYGSIEYDLINQYSLNSSLTNKSLSPSNKNKKKEEKKKESEALFYKGQVYLVDNTKPIEQINYEEEYKKKLEERRKKEEEMAKIKQEKERKMKEEEDRKKNEREDQSKNIEEERKKKENEEKLQK